MVDTFSKRFGVGPPPVNLKRGEAPHKMRVALLRILHDHPVDVLLTTQALFDAKRQIPPLSGFLRSNWHHIENNLQVAEWYEVFDFIEILCGQLSDYELEEKIDDL